MAPWQGLLKSQAGWKASTMLNKDPNERSGHQFVPVLALWSFTNPSIPILGGLDLFCRPEIEARPRSCLNLSSVVRTADLESGATSSSFFGGVLS